MSLLSPFPALLHILRGFQWFFSKLGLVIRQTAAFQLRSSIPWPWMVMLSSSPSLLLTNFLGWNLFVHYLIHFPCDLMSLYSLYASNYVLFFCPWTFFPALKCQPSVEISGTISNFPKLYLIHCRKMFPPKKTPYDQQPNIVLIVEGAYTQIILEILDSLFTRRYYQNKEIPL